MSPPGSPKDLWPQLASWLQECVWRSFRPLEPGGDGDGRHTIISLFVGAGSGQGDPREYTTFVPGGQGFSVNTVPACMDEVGHNGVPHLKLPSSPNPPATFLTSQRFLDGGQL